MNLTKHAIEEFPKPVGRTKSYQDRIPGLGVMVKPNAERIFFWFRRVRGRRTWRTLGEFPAMTVEQARSRASELNTKLADWKAKKYEGDDPFEQRRDMTFGAALDDYCDKHLRAEAKNPDKAIRAVRWQLNKYIASWSERKLSSVRKQDVLDLHRHMGKQHGQFSANRLVQMLRAVYNHAAQYLDWKGENPARIKLYSERPHQRKRFLKADELARLFAALREEPSRDLRDFVVLALFTGARMGDVLSMRWENVTFDPPAWEIPNPKNQESYIVPLISEAVEVLQSRSPNTDGWVFPGHGATGHVTTFKHSWPALLKRAQITDLRIHDLRRSFGSWQAAAGTSLHIIGKSLGHQSSGSTQIYARLDLDAVRQSIESATRSMLVAAKQKPKLLKEAKRG